MHLLKLVTCIGILIYIYFNLSLLARSLNSKWSKKLFQSWAALASFYFKVWQALFQKGAETVISKQVKVYFKVGQLLHRRAQCYFKVLQLFENGAIISKWGIKTTFADIDSFFKNITVSLKKATLQKKFLWSNKNQMVLIQMTLEIQGIHLGLCLSIGNVGMTVINLLKILPKRRGQTFYNSLQMSSL